MESETESEGNIQLVKLPNAKLAEFLNSLGVAAGNATMTAKHKLREKTAMKIQQLRMVKDTYRTFRTT